MVSRIGDSLFNREGHPGFVVNRDIKKQTLQVETEGPDWEKGRRYGFVNGLEPSQREDYENIIDQMRERSETRERVDFLHDQIETLKQDPKRGVLTRYLQGEMAHIMNSEGIAPRIYSIDENKT